MSDANVSVSFSAQVADFVSGVSEAKDALQSFSAPFGEIKANLASLASASSQAFSGERLQPYRDALSAVQGLERSFAAERAEAAAAIKAGDEAAYSDAMRAAQLATSEEIRLLADGLKQKLALYADEARMDEIGQLARSSLQQQEREYEAFGNTIARACNSRLRGLLSGTESWGAAFKSILGDLAMRFIEWTESTVLHHIAAEAAKTAATTTGVAARTGAEQSGAAASMGAQAAAMIRSILSSAAETFAGVFGFLSPLMGPLAVGPAAAAQATVAGMAGAVASADIGMWNAPKDMLTLIHHNELIMPAAEAGAFRTMLGENATSGGAGGAVHIHPTTNFHVSALDSGSVSQWMKSNSPAMLRAVDEAVRHGARLGLRRLGG